MKRLVVYLFVGVIVLSMTACGRDEKGNHGGGESRTQETTDSAMSGEQANVGTDKTQNGLDQVRSKLIEVLGDRYWPNTETSIEFLENYGLRADMYDAFLCEMPMISDNVDTLIIIQAKEDQLEAVEEAVRSYREELVDDADDQGANEGKIQASRIEALGNYVCFVQLGADITEIYGEEGNDEAVIRHCQEQNELALEAISKVLG